MKVVFLEEVEGTARAGDVKNVADGFARNFLLPRKLAAPATQHYISIANAKATKEARKQDRLDAETRERVLPLVDGKSLTIEVRVGEHDKLFGSVTTRDIAEALQALTKVELEHRHIDLKQPLREVGVHQVPVKLTRNVIATVTVNVEPIGGVVAEEAPAAEALEAEAATEEAPEAEAAAEEAPEAEMVTEEAAAEEPAAEESTTVGTEDEGDQSTESS
jgi:large subunit ribosomal protein L9